jgi:DNA-binding response OmpR family regulator
VSVVLIVDDDHNLLRVMARTLTEAGHTAIEAKDGTIGIEAARTHRPNLIVIDIFMPEKDGLELIREIRRLDSQAKILAISGGGLSGRMDLLHMAPRLGADAILRKPFRPRELLDAVEALVGAAPPAS